MIIAVLQSDINMKGGTLYKEHWGENETQPAGFEPARAEPIGFQVQRLNHSAKTAHNCQQCRSLGIWFLVTIISSRCHFDLETTVLLHTVQSDTFTGRCCQWQLVVWDGVVGESWSAHLKGASAPAFLRKSVKPYICPHIVKRNKSAQQNIIMLCKRRYIIYQKINK